MDIFQQKLGYSGSEKPENNISPHLSINTTGGQVRKVGRQIKVNGSETIYKHQWETNSDFNNCMQHPFANTHCDILNGTRLQSCEIKRNDYNCSPLNTKVPLHDSLLCKLNWRPKIKAFSLKIDMKKTFNLTLLRENFRDLTKSSINIRGVLSCEASSKKMKQIYFAEINFEHSYNIKKLLSDELLRFIEHESAGSTISSNTVSGLFISSEIKTALSTITSIGMIFAIVLVIVCTYNRFKRDKIIR